MTPSTDDPAIAALLRDYIALYSRDTLARWRDLFAPGFTAASAGPDGSITTYTLDTFYARQAALFASGKPISEVLEDPHVDRDGPLACIRSAYAWTDGEVRRRGRLMMLVVTERGRPRIQALTFAYDA